MDDLKRLCDEPVADDGFSKRVLAGLPKREPRPFLRIAVLTGPTGAAAAWIALGGGTISGVASAAAAVMLLLGGVVVAREAH